MADARLELLADSSQIRTATNDLNSLSASGANAEKSQKRIQTSSKAAGAAMGGFSRKAGQAGIQVQQFTGQVTTGTNGLVAFSQQAADLGIVLGAPLIGVFASLGATALLMASDTEEAASSADKLETSLDILSRTAELGAGGLIEYTEEVRKLAEVSELAAAGRVEAAISAANDAALNAARSVTESIQDELNLDGFFADLEGAVASVRASLDGNLRLSAGFGENIAIADALAEKLGITGENARQAGAELVELIAKTQTAKTPEAFIELEERLNSLRDGAGIVATQAIDDLINAISPFIDKGVQAAEVARALGADLEDGVVNPASDASKETAKLTTSLQAQIIALESGAQAAEIYALTQRAVADSTQDQLPALIALTNRKYALKEAQDAAAESAKQEASAQKQLESDYQSFLAILEKAEAAKDRQIEQDANRFDSLKQQIVLQQQQIALDNDQYELQRNLLALGADDGSDLYKQRAEQITALTKQMQSMRFEAELIGTTLQQSMGEIGSSAISTFSQGMAQAIAQGDSLRDTLGSIAQTILSSLLSAIIEYGVRQAVVYSLGASQAVAAESIKTTAITAGLAAQTTAAAAAIGTITTAQVASGATIAAAMAPAAAATSVATAGAAPAAAAPIALSTIGAIMAAIVGGVAIFGRATGGTTRANTPYIVGERGPELFSPNSGGGGRITPFSQLMNRASEGGDSNVVVNVTNNASNSDVQTQESTDSQGNRVIEIVVADLQSRGQIHRAVTSTTTASGRL